MDILIRNLDPKADLDAVDGLYARAADFWVMTERRLPDRAMAQAFFTDCPPGCDPAASHRLGLFAEGRLMGVAELSFGWPAPGDAFLGLQLMAPEARGRGLGLRLLDEVRARAKVSGCPALYLGVIEENRRGAEFWARHGFVRTGVSRDDPDTGHRIHRLYKPL